jgi:hypothetical protein
VKQNATKTHGNTSICLQISHIPDYPEHCPAVDRHMHVSWLTESDFGNRINSDSLDSAVFRCCMTVSRLDENCEQIDAVLNQHQDWFRHMPWAISPQQTVQSHRTTIREWIDEFGEEFQAASTPLSASVSTEACCNRILNLMSGPCRAFVQGVASQSLVYRRIREILQKASHSSAAENSLNHVRNAFRSFGRNDGVRHCVLASAVEAGHERAISVFRDEFDGVRRQLATSFSSRMGESAIDEIWQDVFTDLVWGE